MPGLKFTQSAAKIRAGASKHFIARTNALPVSGNLVSFFEYEEHRRCSISKLQGVDDCAEVSSILVVPSQES